GLDALVGPFGEGLRAAPWKEVAVPVSASPRGLAEPYHPPTSVVALRVTLHPGGHRRFGEPGAAFLGLALLLGAFALFRAFVRATRLRGWRAGTVDEHSGIVPDDGTERVDASLSHRYTRGVRVLFTSMTESPTYRTTGRHRLVDAVHGTHEEARRSAR